MGSSWLVLKKKKRRTGKILPENEKSDIGY
jgi:hypothetical protein